MHHVTTTVLPYYRTNHTTHRISYNNTVIILHISVSYDMYTFLPCTRVDTDCCMVRTWHHDGIEVIQFWMGPTPREIRLGFQDSVNQYLFTMP